MFSDSNKKLIITFLFYHSYLPRDELLADHLILFVPLYTSGSTAVVATISLIFFSNMFAKNSASSSFAIGLPSYIPLMYNLILWNNFLIKKECKSILPWDVFVACEEWQLFCIDYSTQKRKKEFAIFSLLFSSLWAKI